MRKPSNAPSDLKLANHINSLPPLSSMQATNSTLSLKLHKAESRCRRQLLVDCNTQFDTAPTLPSPAAQGRESDLSSLARGNILSSHPLCSGGDIFYFPPLRSGGESFYFPPPPCGGGSGWGQNSLRKISRYSPPVRATPPASVIHGEEADIVQHTQTPLPQRPDASHRSLTLQHGAGVHRPQQCIHSS